MILVWPMVTPAIIMANGVLILDIYVKASNKLGGNLIWMIKSRKPKTVAKIV